MSEGGRAMFDGAIGGGGKHTLSPEIRKLDYSFLALAYRGVPRIEFLQQVCSSIQTESRCEVLELWFREKKRYYRCVQSGGTHDGFRYETVRSVEDYHGIRVPTEREHSFAEKLRHSVLCNINNAELSDNRVGDSLYVGDLDVFRSAGVAGSATEGKSESAGSGEFGSMALIPVKFCDEIIGVLQLNYGEKAAISAEKVMMYEDMAGTLGIALMTQQAQSALRERVKELTCLYSIAQVTEREGISLEGILKGIVELLPPAWQYPEITSGRIILDGKTQSTPGFQEDTQKQSSRIVVGGKTRGSVEVVYSEPKPDLDEGPFLSEERSLIDAIARQIALIVERKETEEERAKLREQLRHADRLATLGQLAAGVAHEINEPLGSMLGFAQLARKHDRLPEEARKDIEKIEAASLHAREVVKKLMLFGRQMPPQKTNVNINRMIEEGLYFIKSRCKKNGVEIKLRLSPDLPEITADQSQIYQALVNLVVNAVQAMPDGGILTIRTAFDDAGISLIVEDTGIGMDEETRGKVFLPFFTTKEINEGTGIGLSVVHGIVTSHGGQIKVESKSGRGTRFEILLPIKSRKEKAGQPDDEG